MPLDREERRDLLEGPLSAALRIEKGLPGAMAGVLDAGFALDSEGWAGRASLLDLAVLSSGPAPLREAWERASWEEWTAALNRDFNMAGLGCSGLRVGGKTLRFEADVSAAGLSAALADGHAAGMLFGEIMPSLFNAGALPLHLAGDGMGSEIWLGLCALSEADGELAAGRLRMLGELPFGWFAGGRLEPVKRGVRAWTGIWTGKHPELLKELLAQGRNPDEGVPYDIQTAKSAYFARAAAGAAGTWRAAGDEKDLDRQGKSWAPPLLLAAWAGSAQSVLALLEAGADPGRRLGFGKETIADRMRAQGDGAVCALLDAWELKTAALPAAAAGKARL